MGKRIVLQNEIDQQYSRFQCLTKNFSDLTKDISLRLSLVSGAFRRSGGQTTIISTCRLQSRCLLDIAVVLHDGAELLRISKETMRNLDETIRQEINNKDLPSVQKMTFGDTTSAQIIANPDGSYNMEFNGDTYHVLNYEPFVLSQNDDNINHDNYMDVDGVNQGCTITCMAIIWWMMHGQDAFRDPSEFCLYYNGINSNINAVWAKGNISMSGAMSQSDALSIAYGQLSEGKPCMMYANHSYGPHAVVIVGVKEGADAGNLSPNDFLIIDPWDGQTKSLSDIGYYSNFMIGSYTG